MPANRSKSRRETLREQAEQRNKLTRQEDRRQFRRENKLKEFAEQA